MINLYEKMYRRTRAPKDLDQPAHPHNLAVLYPWLSTMCPEKVAHVQSTFIRFSSNIHFHRDAARKCRIPDSHIILAAQD